MKFRRVLKLEKRHIAIFPHDNSSLVARSLLARLEVVLDPPRSPALTTPTIRPSLGLHVHCQPWGVCLFLCAHIYTHEAA